MGRSVGHFTGKSLQVINCTEEQTTEHNNQQKIHKLAAKQTNCI